MQLTPSVLPATERERARERGKASLALPRLVALLLSFAIMALHKFKNNIKKQSGNFLSARHSSTLGRCHGPKPVTRLGGPSQIGSDRRYLTSDDSVHALQSQSLAGQGQREYVPKRLRPFKFPNLSATPNPSFLRWMKLRSRDPCRTDVSRGLACLPRSPTLTPPTPPRSHVAKSICPKRSFAAEPVPYLAVTWCGMRLPIFIRARASHPLFASSVSYVLQNLNLCSLLSRTAWVRQPRQSEVVEQRGQS